MESGLENNSGGIKDSLKLKNEFGYLDNAHEYKGHEGSRSSLIKKVVSHSNSIYDAFLNDVST